MKERQVVNAPFFKFTGIGFAAAGRVTRYEPSSNPKNTDYVLMEPCFTKRGTDGKWMKYPAACIGLTTDLARKIKRDDVGTPLLVEFIGTKPATNPSQDPQKLFKVSELERDEVVDLSSKATDAPDGENPNGAHGTSGHATDDDDDLPF